MSTLAQTRRPSAATPATTYQSWVATSAKQPMVRQDLDPGPLGDEDVEVAVEHCGVCHSDLSVYNNDWGVSQFPAVLGHEVIGRITAAGPSVKARNVGQRVGVGWFSGSDMHCRQCMSGNYGRLHVVGAVPEPIPVAAFSLILQQRAVSGSPTGSPVAIETMLDFASRHNIAPQTEHFPMSQINEAFARLAAGKAHYRIVLDADF